MTCPKCAPALDLLKIAKPDSDRAALLIVIATALDALGAPQLAWPLLREAAKDKR
jgi:hypothetical protein